MYLSSFDFDLPYIENIKSINSLMNAQKCTYEEALKIDYILNWKEKRRNFRLETRCITSMFERLLGKFKNEKCQKIIIECSENNIESSILNFSGIITVQLQMNHEKFLKKKDIEKKEVTLKLLMKGIKKVAINENWNLDPFENISEIVKSNKYSNEWIWKKPIKNLNKSYSAEVLCQHSVKNMDIFIIVKEINGDEIYREKIISELPDEWAYSKHLGELKWMSNSEIGLTNKAKSNTITILVPSLK